MVVYQSFVQPAVGGNVTVPLIGDPILRLDDTLILLGYGVYHVTAAFEHGAGEGSKNYRLQLLRRHTSSSVTSSGIVPAGTVVNTFVNSTTSTSVNYNATIALSFRGGDYQSIYILDGDGDLALSAQQHGIGRSIVVRIINQSGGSRMLSFPASWLWVGIRPDRIADGKTGVLSLSCLGDETTSEISDLDVVAAWAAQA